MKGIHHITAITASPHRNIQFYEGVLGLRLVKLTINQDDPSAYHIYFGDGVGTPGTILTFFDFGNVPRGVPGPGQVTRISFAVPEGSFDFWRKHLAKNKVSFSEEKNELQFYDPDHMAISLRELNRTEHSAWGKALCRSKTPLQVSQES